MLTRSAMMRFLSDPWLTAARTRTRFERNRKVAIGLIRTTSLDLDQVAHDMGITVVDVWGAAKGRYIHELRVVTLRPDLSPIQRRCTLAHELGHAHAGDVPTGNGHFDQLQELRADRWAANLLIHQNHFFEAAALHHGHLGAMADELEVTRHLLLTWIADHERKIDR